MARARKMRLTDAATARFKPRAREYTVWDTRVGGLGVRVRPSGHRGYVYLSNVDGRVRKLTLGPVMLKSVHEIRRECLEIAVQRKFSDEGERGEVPLFRDFVASPWRNICYDRYKASTQKRTDDALKNQLLPTFGALPLDRITRAAVHRWFDSYSRTAPGGANRALDVFHQIMNHAVGRGLIASSPARGVKRNPCRKLTRFLSREEIHRLHRVLDTYATGRQSDRQQADIIRLLMLTGCRKGEIVGLRWRTLNENVANLPDSKTGPRSVFLNAHARRIIERQPRGESDFIFPSPLGEERPCSRNLPLWYLVRKQVGIEDVRLHDLRHTFASHAVMRGIPLPVVAKLLGHKQLQMTLRYAHVGDREVEAAAERIGDAITALMNGEPTVPSSKLIT